MSTYKHFVTVTGQLYFCASPIRLDSYNRCQFGCVYCFSKHRATENSTSGFQTASALALDGRLRRVASGQIQSALDEFLDARVPIQLGAMQDPFSPVERDRGVTLDLLKVLADYDYPTIISTKGNTFLREPYRRVLQRMNVYVRISAAGVAERLRSRVDVRCSSFRETLSRVKCLSDLGIPVSLRIQPVIPGFEQEALTMTARAAAAGASHVSFEYLKIASKTDVAIISRAIGYDIMDVFQSLGFKKLGTDYVLQPSAKRDFLRRAKNECRKVGMTFGAGDTEFIHCSDGAGCCSGSGCFLRNARQFRANFVGALSEKRDGEIVRFDDITREWSPALNVHQYLTKNSRRRDATGRFSSWLSLMAHRWNGEAGQYSPSLFAGVEWTGQFDENGFKTYLFNDPLKGK